MFTILKKSSPELSRVVAFAATIIIFAISIGLNASETLPNPQQKFVEIIERTDDIFSAANQIGDEINLEKDMAFHLQQTYVAMNIVRTGALASQFRSQIGTKVWERYSDFCSEPNLECTQLLVGLSEFRFLVNHPLTVLYGLLLHNITKWDDRVSKNYFIGLIEVQVGIQNIVSLLHSHVFSGGLMSFKRGKEGLAKVKLEELEKKVKSLWNRTLSRRSIFQMTYTNLNSEFPDHMNTLLHKMENSGLLLDAMAFLHYTERFNSVSVDQWIKKNKLKNEIVSKDTKLVPNNVLYSKALQIFSRIELLRPNRDIWLKEIAGAYGNNSVVYREALSYVTGIELEMASLVPEGLDLEILFDKEKEFIGKNGKRFGFYSLFHILKSFTSSVKQMQLAAEIYSQDEDDDSFAEYEWSYYAIESAWLKLNCMMDYPQMGSNRPYIQHLMSDEKFIASACNSKVINRHLGNSIATSFGQEKFLHDNSLAIHGAAALVGFGVASKASQLVVQHIKRRVFRSVINDALLKASMAGFTRVGNTLKKSKWRVKKYTRGNHMTEGERLSRIRHLDPLSRDHVLSAVGRRVITAEAVVDIVTFINVYKGILHVVGKEDYWQEDEGFVGNILVPIGTGVMLRLILPSSTTAILFVNRGRNESVKKLRHFLRDVIVAGSISGGVKLRQLIGKRSGFKIASKAGLKYGNRLFQRFFSRGGTGEQALDDANEQELNLDLFIKAKESIKNKLKGERK